MSNIVRKHIRNIGEKQENRIQQLEQTIKILSSHLTQFKENMSKDASKFMLREISLMKRELDIRKFYLS
jgi:hypothetical protein